jgi:hypothetical protein
MSDDDTEEEDIFVTKVGPIAIDWPRSIGFFGGIAAAVALDLIAWPLGVAIALVPLVKLLKREHASTVEKAVAAVIEGAAKPVGGDAEGCVRPRHEQEERERKAAKEADEEVSAAA